MDRFVPDSDATLFVIRSPATTPFITSNAQNKQRGKKLVMIPTVMRCRRAYASVFGIFVIISIFYFCTTNFIRPPPAHAFRPGRRGLSNASRIVRADKQAVLLTTLDMVEEILQENNTTSKNLIFGTDGDHNSCGSFACWKGLLASVQDENGTIVVYCSSKEYADLMNNFRCRLRSLSITNAVLVALDTPTFQFAKQEGIPVLFDHSFTSGSYPTDCDIFRSNCFILRTHLKTAIAARILALGLNVLFSDVDVIWLRNPLAYLSDQISSLSSANLLIQSDNPLPSSPMINVNSGFFFARNDTLTLKTFATILKLAINASVTQQPIFNGILCGTQLGDKIFPNPCLPTQCGTLIDNSTCIANATTSLITRSLDRDLFPHGRWNYYFSSTQLSKDHPHIFVIHNNWLVGLQSKISRLRSHGLWEWNAENKTCVSDPIPEFLNPYSIPSPELWINMSLKEKERIPTSEQLGPDVILMEKIQHFRTEATISRLPESLSLRLPSPKSVGFVTHPWARYMTPEDRSLQFADTNRTLPLLQAYTSAHGYSLSYEYQFAGGFATQLGRLKAIKAHFWQHKLEWIVWVDIDVIIANHRLDLNSFFYYARADTHLIWTIGCDADRTELEQDTVPPVNPKMMIIRNSAEGLALMTNWERELSALGYGRSQQNTTRQSEQRAFANALDVSPTTIKGERGDLFLPSYMMLSGPGCMRRGYFATVISPEYDEKQFLVLKDQSEIVK